MIEEKVQDTQPQIYLVKAVKVSTIPPVVFSRVAPTDYFSPKKARRAVMTLFDLLHPTPNPNQGRLSRTAKSLTFGAHKGRGSDNGCVVNGTNDAKCTSLIEVVHQFEQAVDGPALPYLGFQVLKLEKGQSLNQHRDYHNHPDHPNHTMKFGTYQGGSLQMLREDVWYSYDKYSQWLSFDALKVVHESPN